jgi:hypothetical protein
MMTLKLRFISKQSGISAAAAVAMLATIGAASAQSAAACKLLTLQEVSTVAGVAAGTLHYDAPTVVNPQAATKLPATIMVEQCHGDIRASGAVTLRIGLVVAKRSLSDAEWQQVDKALEEPEDQVKPTRMQIINGAKCWVDSQKLKKVTLHSAGCSIAKQRHLLDVSFEHEDASKLPDLSKVRELLARAEKRLAGP